MAAPRFHLELSQNKYLSTSDETMHAVLTVRAEDTGVAEPEHESAEVLLVDCSASMDWPPTKIVAAKKATRIAIDTLRDGVHFGVVQGTSKARMVYPDGAELVRADARTKAAAKAAVAELFPSGGTAMGSWLTLARQLLDRHPRAIRHAILLTDGKNESESPEHLGAVLAECEGHFSCDARGIGDHWEPAELRRIVSVLHGTADAVLEDSELAHDFELMISAAMGKVLPDLRLRLVVMPFARLKFVKQVFPHEVDLTPRCLDLGDGTIELPTGAWGDEHREYHLCLGVDTGGLRQYEDLQFGRVELTEGDAGEPLTEKPEPVLGYLTDDLTLSSVLDHKVAMYTGQAELGEAVRDGWDAFERGDRTEAEREWGTALRLATELGNEEILKRLGRLVDVDDGVVRIKDHVRPRDGFSLVLGSTISEFGASIAELPTPETGAGGQDVECAGCGRILKPGAKVCGKCGRAVDGGVPA